MGPTLHRGAPGAPVLQAAPQTAIDTGPRAIVCFGHKQIVP